VFLPTALLFVERGTSLTIPPTVMPAQTFQLFDHTEGYMRRKNCMQEKNWT